MIPIEKQIGPWRQLSDFPGKTRNRITTVIIIAVLTAIGTGMLLLSWRKWPDILVDFGWELYAPWLMNNGAILYKDILSFFGPLSFCVNALLFKIFGAGLMSIVCFNILLIVILTFIIFRFFLLTTDRMTAAITSVVFLSMFAFAQYVGTGNYNFVCPYSHQMTHGILLSFIALYLFAIYLKRRHDYLLFIIALLTGLVFLSKSEVFIALFASLLSGAVLMAFMYRAAFKRLVMMSLVFLAGFLLPIIAFMIYLSRTISFFNALSAITAAYRCLLGSGIASNVFYRSIMGTDSVADNLSRMFIAVCYYLAALTSMWLVGTGLGRIKDKRLRIFFIGTLLVLVYVVATSLAFRIPWFTLFRGLPLAMLGLEAFLFASLVMRRGSEENCARMLSLFAMTGFGLFLLAKMALNVHIFHYGFALALPSTLLLCMVFVYGMPLLFEKSVEEKFIVRILGIALVGVTVIFHVAASKRIYDVKQYPVGSGPDLIMTFNSGISMTGPYVQSALKEIERRITRDENFLVLPEGIMLNYLARRKSPYPYVNIMPFELATIGEERLLGSLISARPDYLILMDRNTSEFGYRYFGQDYGVKIYAWIRNNYLPVSLIGNNPFSGSGFGILITKRKER